MSGADDQSAAQPATSVRRRAWRAWRAASWGRRLWMAPKWIGKVWALFQTNAAVPVLVGAAGFGAVGVVAIVAPEVLPWPQPAPVVVALPPPLPFVQATLPPELTTPPIAAREKLADNSTVFTIVGNDAAGRQATFELLLLSRSIAWVRGSASDIERDGKDLTEDEVTRDVLGGDVKRRLSASSEIIAAGAASSEGTTGTEIERAAKRAETTASWIKQIASGMKVSTLNLGQYQARCAADGQATDTSWQRPLLIIGVRAKADNVQLDQALRDAMDGKSNLPRPTCYSHFDLKPPG